MVQTPELRLWCCRFYAGLVDNRFCMFIVFQQNQRVGVVHVLSEDRTSILDSARNGIALGSWGFGQANLHVVKKK